MTTTLKSRTVNAQAAREFLELGRIAVVGASPTKGNFGATIASALHDHGTHVVVVHPAGVTVNGLPSYRSLHDVPGALDGVIVMVRPADAVQVLRDCAAKGIRRAWLFRGIGSPGAVSPEVLDEADAQGVEVIPGACPLMFLEPVGWFHRVHRTIRRRRGAVTR